MTTAAVTTRKGYQGKDCQCTACQTLTPAEREGKYSRIQEARRAGGKARAVQPSMQEARSTGFWTTMERHSFFARKWLKKKIKTQDVQRALRQA